MIRVSLGACDTPTPPYNRILKMFASIAARVPVQSQQYAIVRISKNRVRR